MKREERIYVSNITYNETIKTQHSESTHRIICDCYSETSKHLLKNVHLELSSQDFESIQRHGYYVAKWDNSQNKLKTWKNEHSDECHYTDQDCMQYALMKLSDHFMALIDANELSFFDDLLERGQKEDTDLQINESLIESEPYKIVYGALLVNCELMETEEAMNIAREMANYGFIYIKKEDAILSQYCTIEFFPELRKCNNLIPFAACMKLPLSLENKDFSITLTPVIGEKCIWEYMVNRPFLLACRGESVVENLSYYNFGEHINISTMLEAYNVADIVTNVDETNESFSP